jgi:ATP-binding protein involved in chromosome partitioning
MQAGKKLREARIQPFVSGFGEGWLLWAFAQSYEWNLFGKDGGKKLATELQVPLLGEIPIVESICDGGDKGKPVALNESSITGMAFQQLAQKVVERVDYRNENMEASRTVFQRRK